MIKGIGIDIIEVERVKKSIEKNKNFKFRIFSKEEIDYCEKHKYPYMHYAGKFAAKEAFYKATGLKIPFKEVIVKNGEGGQPYIYMENFSSNLIISISHIKEYAVAVVVLED